MSKQFKIESPKAEKHSTAIEKFEQVVRVEEGNRLIIDNDDFFYDGASERLTPEFFQGELTDHTNNKIEAAIIGVQNKAGTLFANDKDLDRAYFDIQLGSAGHRMTGSVDRCVKGSMKAKDGSDVPYESHLQVRVGVTAYAAGKGIDGIKKVGKEAFKKFEEENN